MAEWWNGGTVGTQATIRLIDRGSRQRLCLWFFGGCSCAFLRVVIPKEFQLDSARISREQIKKTTRENARKPANAFWG
jgi:hypothetical protein